MLSYSCSRVDVRKYVTGFGIDSHIVPVVTVCKQQCCVLVCVPNSSQLNVTHKFTKVLGSELTGMAVQLFKEAAFATCEPVFDLVMSNLLALSPDVHQYVLEYDSSKWALCKKPNSFGDLTSNSSEIIHATISDEKSDGMCPARLVITLHEKHNNAYVPNLSSNDPT